MLNLNQIGKSIFVEILKIIKIVNYLIKNSSIILLDDLKIS